MMRKQYSKSSVLSIVILGFCISFSLAQTSDPKSTLFDSLYALDIAEIQVLVDIDSILANKFTKREQEAMIAVRTTDNEVLDLPLDIQVRSKSRRRYCDFPPLKFDFKKGFLKDWGLDKHDDFKIVTHCLDDSKGLPTMLKEYLVYKLYEIVTPLSLRTILFDIIYKDIGGSKVHKTKAIMLESEEGFAKKHEGTLCECMGTKPDSIDPFQFELVAMFQYMIGNSDMNYMVERNVTLVRDNEHKRLIPIPYDFDFSGFVNAPYVHPEVFDNKLIPRVYLGFEQNSSHLPAVIDRFIAKKKEIINTIDDFELIDHKERKACTRYVKAFYRQIENPRFLPPYTAPE
ncbi:MAG: hypothetical protein HKN87_07230 [Saprospiraceae bacterium]|nr:hypothetical protein [Saprospiraceae bacterium]